MVGGGVGGVGGAGGVGGVRSCSSSRSRSGSLLRGCSATCDLS